MTTRCFSRCLLVAVVLAVSLAPTAARAEGAPDPAWLSSIFAQPNPPLPDAETSPPAAPPAQDGLETLDDRQAWELLADTFPAQAEGELRNPAEGKTVERYVGDRVAEVPGGVLVSTVPLRAQRADGTLAPTRLELVDAGAEHTPLNAPFTLKLSESRPGALTIGPQPEQAVTVEPLHDAPAVAQVRDDRLFWPETAPATDTLVLPTSSGAETFEQLRGPQAPERFVYRLTLPAGATLRATGDGGAEVVQGDRRLLFVPPPAAFDATGAAVATRLEITAEGIAISVDHRRPEVSYPVLADPQWVSSYQFQSTTADGFEGWSVNRYPNDNSWYSIFGTNDPGASGHSEANGLWIIPKGGKTYTVRGTTAPFASAVFIAPGNGTISSIRFDHVRYYHYEHPQTGKGDGQAMRLAVYDPNRSGWTWGKDYAGAGDEVNDVSVPSGPLPAGSKVATFWLFTAGCGAGNDCDWSVPTASKASWAQVGGVEMVLEDPEAPSVAQGGEVATRGGRWINAATGALSWDTSAADPTSGLTEVYPQSQLRGQGVFSDVPGTTQPSCDVDHHTPGRQGALCTQGISQSLSWDPAGLPSPFAGWVSFRVRAKDASGQEGATAPSTVWVDRTAPSLAFSGQLWDARDTWLNATGGHAVRAVGHDTTVAGESGVAAYDLTHTVQADDGAPVSGPTPLDGYDACPAPNGAVAPPADWSPCPKTGPTRNLTGVNLPQGRNRIAGTARDYAGNTGGASSFDVYVDATRPTLTLTGALADLDGTWGAPEGPLQLTATPADGLSGVEDLSVDVLHDGEPLDNVTERDQCPAPQDPGLRPCPRTPSATTVGVTGDDLPEGKVSIQATTHDHAGNERTRAVEMYVDRTPPIVSLEGELAGLDDDGFQDPAAGPVQAVVNATDNMSGVKRLELWVRDADGHEELLDGRDVCDETSEYTGDGPPCPLIAREIFDVSLDGLPDGDNMFFARAIEYAGKRATDRVRLDIDDTPPATPTSLQVTTTGEDSATVSWQPGPEPADDVGVDHYVISVLVNGVTVRENVSPYPGATIGGLPPGVSVQFLIKAVDPFNRSSKSAASRAYATEFGGPLSWAQCETWLGKKSCDTLRLRKSMAKSVIQQSPAMLVGVVCVDWGKCWDAADRLGLVKKSEMDSVGGLVGQMIGSCLTPAGIVDLFNAIKERKALAAGFAAVGLAFPAAKGGKALKRVYTVLERNPRAALGVAEYFAMLLGRHVDKARGLMEAVIPGYKAMRGGGLSHEGVSQLMRGGNDLVYLAANAAMLKRVLSEHQRDLIERAIDKHWRTKTGNNKGKLPAGNAYAGAYGHEAAIRMLDDDVNIDILYTGRGQGLQGPDIIAWDRVLKRPVIVEAKGTRAGAPLTDKTVTTTPRDFPRALVQPERAWLDHNAERRYLNRLQRSSDPLERRAATLIEDILDGAPYDVKIIQTRPPGADAYGPGIQTVVQQFRRDPDVRKVDIYDVDAGTAF